MTAPEVRTIPWREKLLVMSAGIVDGWYPTHCRQPATVLVEFGGDNKPNDFINFFWTESGDG